MTVVVSSVAFIKHLPILNTVLNWKHRWRKNVVLGSCDSVDRNEQNKQEPAGFCVAVCSREQLVK